MLGIVTEQSKYNLLTRHIEWEVIPACRDYGMGVLPWSPLAGGALAGDSRSDADGRRASQRYDESTETQRERFHELCREVGQEPPVVALAWLLSNPVVTAPIIGPRTLDQLNSAPTAAELTLDSEILAKLDEIFPGPGNQAPEAYAW